jgi:hypothetical protein
VYDSIRLIFSIADLQSAEDNLEPSEGEEGLSEETEVSYPLRCSLTLTKVCDLRALYTVVSF